MNAATPLIDPSDALAALADAMSQALSLDQEALQEELGRVEADITPPEEWLLPGTELCAEIIRNLGAWPPLTPTGAKDFALCAVALQRLDRWHRPLLPSTTLPRLAEHESILNRMAIEDRFNANTEHGIVIPRQAFGSPFLRLDAAEFDWSADSSPYAITCSLLDICVFLPAHVSAGDPDAENSTVGSRRIEFIYRRFPPEELGLPWPLDALRIAIAPVAERENDACLWVEGDRYAVEPTVPIERLEALLRGALAGQANVLLLPEMTVDAALLPTFRQKLKTFRREAAQNDPNWSPCLHLILIGVIEAPRDRGSPHRNYVAAIKANGDILFTQDKLSHWNLDARAQSRFGIDGLGYPVPLMENTAPGTKATIAEFDGLGRLMALICADMSHDMPGDWVAANIGLDWLYAPIMDGSTCWSQGYLPWIVRRALRSCDRTGTTVLVTNSMVMTHWKNRVIARDQATSSSRYKRYDTCGIGFIARREGVRTVVHHTTVDLSDTESPILRIIDWSADWTAPPTL